jgi:hypothetical protein
MTQDEIIEMAREAGFTELEFYGNKIGTNPTECLERFAALVRADEREACAKVCDAVAQQMDDEGEGPTGNIGWVSGCAAAIRARGQA